jgi:uncharacterized protein (TIGR02466 family)
MNHESTELSPAQILPLWVTPLYISNISSASSYTPILESSEWKRFDADNGYITNDTYILNHKDLTGLLDEIKKHIDTYTRDVFNIANNVDFYITNSWGVKHSAGDWAPKHHHTNSLFSGVVYLKCNNNSGNIKFYKNTGFTTGVPECFDFDYTENNIFNSTSYSIEPKDNMIVIFPSHLEHSVDTSNSNDFRFAISFNIFFKGKIGGNKLEKMCDLELK